MPQLNCLRVGGVQRLSLQCIGKIPESVARVAKADTRKARCASLRRSKRHNRSSRTQFAVFSRGAANFFASQLMVTGRLQLPSDASGANILETSGLVRLQTTPHNPRLLQPRSVTFLSA